MAGTEPGWYPDHADPGQVRYWDGAQWTDHVAPAPAATAGGGDAPADPPSRSRLVLLAAVALLVVAAVAVAVVVLTGDDTEDEATEDTGSDDSEADTDDTDDAGEPTGGEAVAGTWVGTYTCPQGDTGLELTIEDDGDDEVIATFAFSPLSSNPDVEPGAFTMTGTFDDGELELEPDEWIDQPEGYAMIGLESRALDVESGEVVGIAGDVTLDSACSTFLVTRD